MFICVCHEEREREKRENRLAFKIAFCNWLFESHCLMHDNKDFYE